MDWSRDVEAADWIVRRLHPFASDVGSLVPEGFGAYARILHPARAPGDRPVRWAELARLAGVELRPATMFESLAEAAAAEGVTAPESGTLQAGELGALTDVLARHTAQPGSCRFGLWDGFGWLQGPPAVARLARGRGRRPPPPGLPEVPPGTPRLEIPARTYLLWSGPVEAAGAFIESPTRQSPNLWWPDDHAWCVASEIDLDSTYVGGPQALADQLLADERLEALPATVGDPVNAAGRRAS